MIVCVTTTSRNISNVDFDVYDLAKLPADHPFRVSMEEAAKGNKYVHLEDDACEEMFAGEALKHLEGARVKLPAYVESHIEIYLED